MLGLTRQKKIVAALVSGMLFFPAISYADIVLSGTRVIYHQENKDVIVNMENRGNKPLLVQSWIDDGRDTTNPQELKVPFVVTPPVARVDPNEGQTLRINYMGQPLPEDKESLFWLNVMEIPPKSAKSTNSNLLQLAFRTRIKLLYRPKGLKGDPLDAVEQLQWSLKKDGDKIYVVAKNNLPWNVSISEGKIISNKQKYNIDVNTVAPFSSQTMLAKGLNTLIKGNVDFKAINDFGGTVDQVSQLH